MGNVTINGDLTGTAVGGLVGGAANLTTAGAIPYVSAAGILNQTANLSFDVANNRFILGSATVQRFSTDLSLSRASAGVLQVGDGAANANGRISAGQSTFDGLTVGRGAGAVLENSAIGFGALSSNTTGVGNTSLGYLSMVSNLSGNYNTALGYTALYGNTSGANNSAVGVDALSSNTTGSQNVAIGREAGRTATSANANTTGSNNTWVGYQSGPSSTVQRTNSVAIGYQALVGADNAGVLGTAGMKWSVGGQTVPSATLHVENTSGTVTQATTLVVKAATNQSTTNLTEWQNSGGTVLTRLRSDGELNVGDASALASGGVYFSSTSLVRWTNSTSTGATVDLSLCRASSGLLEINNGTAGTYRDLILRRSQYSGVTVADLPTAAAGNAGSIQYVTDANATTIGSTVVGGGANKVMVWSDGAAWKIFAS